ncbi:MAG: hypothetical protein L0Z50_33650 [Verrucomicrobiales bacterium]|nr:hypothetical protein [Verrucomicrobiales bacterium]
MRIVTATGGTKHGFDHARSIEPDEDGTFIVHDALGATYRLSASTAAALGFGGLTGRQELPGYRPAGVNDQRVVE